MFSVAVVPVIKSVIPNIATQILEFYKLNNHYTILISTILQELISYISNYLTDEYYIITTMIIFGILTMIKYGLFTHYIMMTHKNSIELIANVKLHDYSNEFLAINKILLRNQNVTTYQFMGFGSIAHVKNILIEPNKNIYVTTEIDKNIIIKFILTTKKENIINYLNKIVKEEIYYNKKFNYEIIVSHDDIHENKYKNIRNILLCLKNIYNMQSNKCLININNNNNNNNNDDDDDDNNDIYLFDDCENIKLNDLLFIRIHTYDKKMKYLLLSDQQIFSNFIKECNENIINKNKKKYKYSHIIMGSILSDYVGKTTYNIP